MRIRVRGQVQGVGFRPFVWQLAGRFDIRGAVLNDPEGVLIQATGDRLEAFLAALHQDAPPLSRIDAIEVSDWSFAPVPERFEIAASTGSGAETRVTPDAATCADCVNEIRGDGRRRHYPFTNCTNCGPRYTILEGLPYDRAQTTMAAFAMCDACRAEYEDPGDRRFHAQPIACPDCGPRLWWEVNGTRGAPEEAGAVLRAGGIVAVKGLGGFHLACDATNPHAIALLRARKRRPAKPFAVMAGIGTIRAHAALSDDGKVLLRDPAAPIVLLRKAGVALPDGLAPGQDRLGWMLPHTPLHHLLLREWASGPLVMTSGNLSGEPQVIGNAEAREKLAGFADGFLMHDRAIARRLDDSVECAEPRMVLRRARGRVPGTLPLPDGFGGVPPVLACGGQMKAALCLLKNGQALLGHHLGELDQALTWDAYLQADADYAALFDHRPHRIAVDLHPGYRASQHGSEKAAALDVPLIEVQHHHAHLASCLAENGWSARAGRVAGIILDGTGLGPDGTVWGGEVLLGDYHGYERRAWLKPAPLIGGDMAALQPWRNALARLDQAGLGDWADALFSASPRHMLRQAAARGMNAPLSSSAGRLFDAVAAVLGLCPDRQTFEGEAAMRLEAAAGRTDGPAGFVFGTNGPEIDPGPVFHAMRREIDAGWPASSISARFHAGLARAFADKAGALVEAGEARAVALSGGCFQNARLLAETVKALGDVPVLIHTRTPANDGGLALGQALVAAAAHAGGGKTATIAQHNR